jgi:hypothetical protein
MGCSPIVAAAQTLSYTIILTVTKHYSFKIK